MKVSPQTCVCTKFDIHVFISYDDGGISFRNVIQLNAIAIAQCNDYHKYTSDAGTHVSQRPDQFSKLGEEISS